MRHRTEPALALPAETERHGRGGGLTVHLPWLSKKFLLCYIRVYFKMYKLANVAYLSCG